MEKININKYDKIEKASESLRDRMESPSKSEELKSLIEKIEKLKEDLRKYGIHGVSLENARPIPDHLTPQEKKEIFRVQRDLQEAKVRLEFFKKWK